MSRIDEVWEAARDGRWHTISDLAGSISRSRGELRETIIFLLKYGFAEESRTRNGFRVRLDVPSPREVAEELRSAALDPTVA